MTTGAQPTVKEQPVPPRLKPVWPGKNLVALIRTPIPFLSQAAQYGDVVRVSDGGQETYLINHPDYIRDILVIHNRSFHKSPVLRRMGALLGQGLLTSEDELHFRQRRLIQPAFHRQRIAEYARIMTAYTDKTSARWQDGKTYDIHEEMMRLTMVIVGHALFGADVENEASEIGKAITTLLSGSRRLLLPFWEKIQHWPVAGNQRIYAAGQALDGKIREMVAVRRRLEEHREEQGEEPSLQQDLLDMLLRARDDAGDGQGMSDEQVRDEVITLFIAGHETTANALTWPWYLLSQHPDVEARLHSEIEQVLGRRTPTADDFEKLENTRRVLSESMRLYPPAWTISRQALNDYPVGPYVLPKGAVLLLSQWVMHHDARYYPDPFRFDPERWTPEAVAARPRYSYFPFGGGPRMCVGEPFAWMEGVLVLAMLAQHWQMRLDPSQRVDLLPQVTLRPKYGMRMRVERR